LTENGNETVFGQGCHFIWDVSLLPPRPSPHFCGICSVYRAAGIPCPRHLGLFRPSVFARHQASLAHSLSLSLPPLPLSAWNISVFNFAQRMGKVIRGCRCVVCPFHERERARATLREKKVFEDVISNWPNYFRFVSLPPTPCCK